MIDDIVKSTEQAAAALAEIKAIPVEHLDKDMVLALFRKAVNLKLMIQEEEEEEIKNLVIMSIKQQEGKAGGRPDDAVSNQIKKYDCHQTSLLAQKKTLLFLFMERELGVTLEDDEAVGTNTMEQLAEIFIKHLGGGKTDE